MRGILKFAGERYHNVILYTGFESRDVVFFRNGPEDELLYLHDYRLEIPGDGSLRFTGYRLTESLQTGDGIPIPGEKFQYVEVEFRPPAVMAIR